MIYKEILEAMMKGYSSNYIVVKTKYTDHHIERLMPTCKDRGRWKWIAESNHDYYDNLKDTEARRSHIDEADLFPRLYFEDASMVNELFAWLKERGLTITDIKAPKI